VAVIEAGHDPFLEHDLYIYRAQFGLPPCLVRNGCLRIVDGSGGTNYPPDSASYIEAGIDVDMVSANCQDCDILVVEANVPLASYQSEVTWLQSLSDAVDTAVSLGASAVSVSFATSEANLGGPQGAQEDKKFAAAFNHPGVVITASSGDSGYGAIPGSSFPFAAVPAAFPTVIAVGGTSLLKTGIPPRGWLEVAWSGSGSGCSDVFLPPFWQSATQPCGAHREIPDISYDADPAIGMAFYSTTIQALPCPTCSSWQDGAGTSASAPAIAALFMLGNKGPLPAAPAIELYASDLLAPQLFWDVLLGTNAMPTAQYPSGCLPVQLCNAGPGFDGPTGIGTPNGVDEFYPVL
jgi:subtilase family serine protease